MIRLIFIVIAFFLMIGGLVGGLYYWGIDPLAKVGLHLTNAPGAPEAKPKPAPPSFVDFGLLLVPVIQEHQVKHQAEMILRLQVDPPNKDEVGAQLPRLQAAFLEDMMEFLPVVLRDGSELDLVAIRRRLMVVSDRIVGRGTVKDIIVENSELK